MPPYANQQQQDDYVQVLNGTNYDANTVDIPLNKPSRPTDDISFDTNTKSLLPIPPPPPLPEEQEQQEDDAQPEKKPGMMSKMLDFNLCTAKIPNPSSALFKERRCAECGSKVYKYRDGGYEKEVVTKQVAVEEDDEDVPDEATVHETSLLDFCVSNNALADDVTALSDIDLDFDDDGSARSEQDAKSTSSSCCGKSAKSNETAVSSVKVNQTTGVETKIYFKKSCYKKRQMRTAHRESGYGLVLTDLLNYHYIKAERERLAREEEVHQRLADKDKALFEEAERLLALEQAARKERSLKGRTKKALKNVKKTFSFKGCFGSTVAVAEPQKVKAQPVQLSWGSHEEHTFGDSDEDVFIEAPQRPVELTWGSNREHVAENTHSRRDDEATEQATKQPEEPPSAVQLSWGGQQETVAETNNRLEV